MSSEMYGKEALSSEEEDCKTGGIATSVPVGEGTPIISLASGESMEGVCTGGGEWGNADIPEAGNGVKVLCFGCHGLSGVLDLEDC